MKLNEEINKIKKLILELSPKSSGVEDFIDKVKDTPGLNQFLDFNTVDNLKEYIYDGSQKDFDELRERAKEFNDLTEKEQKYYVDKQHKEDSKKKKSKK
jgi:hypothetical protein